MNGKNGSAAQRVTILMDENLYAIVQANARKVRMKTYEYVNMVLAKAVGEKVPKLRHPSTKLSPTELAENSTNEQTPAPGGTV